VDALAVATGVKTPRPARGTLLRLIPAVIAGALSGIGTLLCIRNLWTAAAQAHAHCDGNGLTARPCTTGLDTVLAVGLICAVLGVPAAIGYAVRGRWVNRAGMVAAGAAGLLTGQAIFGAVTGTDLPTAWSVPTTVSTELGTIGSMQYGDSVIWVRTDKAVSYDAATGQRRWSLAMPRGSVACAVSDSGAQVGLIGYDMGQPGDECSGVLAVDLATGHRLWSAPLPDASDGVTLLVTGDAAVIVTDGDLTALWAGTGALAVSGDQVYFTDQAIPALFAVSARSGALRSIGTITGPDLDVNQVTLYPAGRHYILVNSRAYPGIAVLAAITS
jgi:hypothetical protein